MRVITCVVVGLVLVGAAYADLQNVQVGGVLEMRGRYMHDTYNGGDGLAASPATEVRGPASWFPHRPIGNSAGVVGPFSWDHHSPDWSFCESAISLNVKADFTEKICAFIEFYNYGVWGKEFRSNYLTGVDSPGAADVSLLQAYVEINDVGDQPLRLRIGRQSLQFGNRFLVAEKTTPTQRISYDAVRATYTPIDKLTIDAWWSKLAENSPLEADGDVDFMGVYSTYALNDIFNASAYWMWVRDARSLNDTPTAGWLQHDIEHALGYNDYNVTNLNTVGIRLFGKGYGFDYNADVAIQFGNAGADGVNYKTTNFLGTFGDDHAQFNHCGADVEAGYTFDCAWKPRIFVGGLHFGGTDNREVNFWQWLNPFEKPRASTAFNRMFTDQNYVIAMQDNGEMSNFDQVRAGVNLMPTEKITLTFRGMQVWADSTFAWPVHWRFGRYIVPVAPIFSFWTKESSNNLGFETDAILKYDYSKNLSILLFWDHLIAGQGLLDGNYSHSYGNGYTGGTGKNDADYLFWWIIMKF